MSIETEPVPGESSVERASRNRLTADVLALDSSDRPVLLVEVKETKPSDEAVQAQLVRYLQRLADTVPFAMFVDRRTIRVYSWDGGALVPLAEIATPEILSVYDPEFAHKTIYEDYLATLVSAWLRDIAYHWKSENPPAYDELKRLGLTDRLDNGTTEREAVLR